MFAARVPPLAFVLHKDGRKPPCAEAHLMPSESKGHDNRARGRVVGVSFAGENVAEFREKQASSFRRFRSRLSAVFWSRTKANGGTWAAAPVKESAP
jgi:hypothetical protein